MQRVFLCFFKMKKVSPSITVMQCAGFFPANEDKLSNQSRSRVAGHNPAPASQLQPACLPAKRWQSAQWAERTEPSIYRAGGSWVRSHGEIMTAGGQVSDSWHLKWRIGITTIINKLWKRISYCHSSVFSSGFQEMWCAVFQSGGRREETQKHRLLLDILLSYWQGMK